MGQWIEGRVQWLADAPNLAFQATNGRGNEVLLGSAPAADSGVVWQGVSPMEVVLLGLGGCTGIDVVSTLRKMRQEVTGYAIRVRGERRDAHPRIYTRIVVEHEIRGRDVRAAAVRRAIVLSAGRYCSVSAMLEAAAALEVTYRVVDEVTGAETHGSIAVPDDLAAADTTPDIPNLLDK